MIKRVFLLNGLAILAVVCNHAASWGYTAMFWWTDRYRSVAVPNFDQFGSLPYYVIVIVRQLTVFSVPAFLFVSGFFLAYAARGSQSALNWKMVKARITNLLIPYFIWSVIILIGDALQGITYAPVEYLGKLVLAKADSAYFYVLLLCQFYLLSPLLVPIAKTRWKFMLFVLALLQLSVMILVYYCPIVFGGARVPALDTVRHMPYWLFVRWAFYFALGIVVAFHLQPFKGWLVRVKWGLLVAVAVLGLLTIIELEGIFRLTGQDYRGGPNTIAAALYSVALVLCYLAFDRVSIPLSETFYQLGRQSYGIYLLHREVLQFSARIIRQIAPWMLVYQALFQPVLIVLGVGVPLLFMVIVARSPARRYYRSLFG